MEKLTRRTLFKHASLGAGMVGLAMTSAACAADGTQTVGAANSTQTAGAAATAAGLLKPSNDPIAVFVTDPAQGTLLIVRGDSEITVTNKEAAQLLLSLR